MQHMYLPQARPIFALAFEEQPQVVTSEGESDGCAPPWRPFALEEREEPVSVLSRAKEQLAVARASKSMDRPHLPFSYSTLYAHVGFRALRIIE